MARVPVLGASVPQEGSRLSRAAGRWGLAAIGWGIEGQLADIPRCVMIVAPHTSNWDFVVGYLAKLALGLRVTFIAKHTLFRGPLGAFLRWVGGIPIDRSEAGGVVERAVALLRERAQLYLVVTPEGTRRKVERWKSGFYRIAQGADVPIIPVAFDYAARCVRLNPAFVLTGRYEADLQELQSWFSSAMARDPARY